MNILFVTFAYLPSLGGVQRSVHNLAREFVRRGHRVVIACDGENPFTYQKLEPAPVFSLRIPYQFHQPWAKRAEAKLLDCVNLPALAALCLREKIEIAHCHLINVDTRYAIALQRWLGLKVVITLRGGEFHHWIEDRPWRREYVRQMLESADAVTALSHSQMADARALTPALPRETRVITNPADPEAIVRHASLGRKEQPAPYILFSGRFEDGKRADLLIDAYHRILARSPGYPFDLVLAGDGSLFPDLQRQAQAGPGASRIRFAGARHYEDSLALIRDAEALVLPSQKSEGCPNVILEAMALGTPVIASDYGPLPEFVAHQSNGELFHAGDVAALENTLRGVAGDAEKRARYTAAARRYLEEKHRFDRISDAYEELYGGLTASQPNSSQTTSSQTSGRARG